jgi:hypothetical protein
MVTMFLYDIGFARFGFMVATAIDTYRRQIERKLQARNATEHTQRPAPKLLGDSAPNLKLPGTSEPRAPAREDFPCR